MHPFSFETAGRILFGRGVLRDAHVQVAEFGSRILLVRGGSVPQADTLASELTGFGCKLRQHRSIGEPTVGAVEAAVSAGRAHDATAVVAIGGGSVIDLGKAAAALIPGPGDVMDHLEGVGGGIPLEQSPLPFVAIPSTAGTGAEVTKNAVIGVPEAGRKVSLRDARMLANLAIVDPGLTDGAPRDLTLAAGLDAITQLIEPYLSSRATPMTDALCQQATPMGLAALMRLMEGEDAGARDRMAYASLMGGLALANAGLGAVHGLAGVIGGRFDAPHGALCGRLLPPVLTENRRALALAGLDLGRLDRVDAWLADALGVTRDTAVDALAQRLDDLGLPRLGGWLGDDPDLDAVARDAAGSSSMKANPVALPPDALARILDAAL
ncbi:iron-containing alcohol dehydrogenase [Sulfitobacter sabulilitoris]|uniref:Iron-containing alcohol dehydrogenase n=1 Tax=Sulfitobacter sabulilitoris TaxID=2562655 RepID=A0A5S3PIG7_9RHOB|nr:iron-containing alcohol dehydrogenase [Sulfitobacter sabulilitoris]TMM54154.1 iron-containing alcohol dehydrogenase [Sulfitobacter sabulilitoris]